jgi:hypothetical protein
MNSTLLQTRGRKFKYQLRENAFEYIPNYNEPGIYCIINKTNGRVYIGKALVSCHKRIELHINDLRCHRHFCEDLQSDYENGDIFFCDVLYEFPYLKEKENRKVLDIVLSEKERYFQMKISNKTNVYNKVIFVMRSEAFKAYNGVALDRALHKGLIFPYVSSWECPERQEIMCNLIVKSKQQAIDERIEQLKGDKEE